MKKRFLAAVAAVLVAGCSVLTLTGCSKQGTDDTRNYTTAILSMPDGTIVQGEVESWQFVYKTQVKVKIGGITYYVGTENVVIMREDKE